MCGLISPTSRCLDVALVELSSTLSHCKFEASDSSGDEVVLLKIITVILDCFSGSIGFGMGDIEVCEMLETVLTTCCQMRLSGMITEFSFETLIITLSETLRRSAETAMHTLVRIVFSKLKDLHPEEEEAKLAIETEDETKEGELRMHLTSQDEKAEEVQSEDPVEPTETTEPVESYQVISSPRTLVSPENRPACASFFFDLGLR